MKANESYNNKKDGKNDTKKTSELPSRVAQWYYRHGLFLTSYPTCATSLAILVILFCCYPLLNFSPLPGKIPSKVVLPYYAHHFVTTSNNTKETFHVDKEINNEQNIHDEGERVSHLKSHINIDTDQLHLNNFSSSSFLPIPSLPWARAEPPFVYVQQIILRSAVLPWSKDLTLTDAFRGPLFEVFKLLEIINNHETNVTLSNLCLHVENVKRSHKDPLFPEYNCLVLSPANFWRQNIHNFNKDNSLLSTIYQHHNNQKSKVSTSEMLFGVPMLASGIKRYPLQNRPRIIQYAITLFMRENNQDFIATLQQKLHKIYPLHQQLEDDVEKVEEKSSVIYIYYPGEFNLIELVPLTIAMTILFVYMYFSIRKVEMIRSRFIVALASVVTVLGSLVMSLGFCFFFGISIWAQSSMGVYPYLLILVGLENCLVITKSVMTTENNLDVKIRVAQGLSKEGWPITKNLMTEITILTAGLVLTFLPLIQEFCIFAIVGLVSDYLLQMFLFSTVLGLNVKRVEVIAEVKKLPKMLDKSTWNVHKKFDTKAIHRSASHPSKLSDLDQLKDTTNVNKTQKEKIPKRLRIVNFWARTRFFQRGFMIWMVLWISNIIYSSGIIENVFLIDKSNGTNTSETQTTEGGGHVDTNNNYEHMVKNLSNIMMDYYTKNVQWNKRLNENMESNITDKIQKLKHPSFEIGNRLSSFHWAGIFRQYNISMIGRYVTILPSIKISHIVPVEVASKIRNSNDIAPSSSKWNALTSALDPLDLNDADGEDDLLDMDPVENQPLYPKTPMEMMLLVILCAVSVFVITYTMIVMYRCICSRNYAEWRASRWDENEVIETNSEQVLEGFPIQVKGHKHNVECVVSDGNLIASSCLQGLLKIWDSNNGELVAEINRIGYFEQLQQYNADRHCSSLTSMSDENLIQQKNSPPRHMLTDQPSSTLTRLKTSLKFDFQSSSPSSRFSSTKNDFQKSFDKYFEPAAVVTMTNHSSEGEIVANGAIGINNNNNNINSFNQINVNHKLHNGCSSDSINSLNSSATSYNTSPIWALDFIDNLIAIGCADGRLEFWEGTTGSFKCIYQTESTHGNGVTHLKLASDKVVAARLSGRIDFLRLETYTQGRHIDWNFTSAYRRTHVRTGSAGSISNFNQQQNQRYTQRNSLNAAVNHHHHGNHHQSSSSSIQHNNLSSNSPTEEELRCILELPHQGHTQPITCLDVLGNFLFTGSQDHTLKVFHTDSNTLFFTLHGHCSPVTSLLIDRFQSGTGCSGSQDGLLCVWDLITGACLYNLQAHEDCLVSIASAPSYIITLGLDERIRVWERFQGHLLSTIILHHAYSNSIVMLTPSLLITAKPGALLVWDVKDGHVKHEVKLDRSEMSQQITPKIMLPSFGSIITDFGHQLRIVRFPLHDKSE
ncbi:CLUMA_CG004425, isoform A [Clunio marinus]|uniref:Sterol regulatory element-binding protein cleavage-activating protein n=1 Tax=Clunio marinus TaxID=568069 RepID=A0A1J1HRT4_9DIPT|nr:CLUMA_CG004425, isoform A [Clunio marinus]